MHRSAEISACGQYRWWLRRDWYDEVAILHEGRRECVFCGLNPSTADDVVDDQTLKIWTAFARRWGYTGFTVVNAYPFRSTDPKGLLAWYDTTPDLSQVMAKNRAAIRKWSNLWPGQSIVCWGNGIDLVGDQSNLLTLECIEGMPQCLGITKSGHPKHPLRLPLCTLLQPYLIEGSTDERL